MGYSLRYVTSLLIKLMTHCVRYFSNLKFFIVITIIIKYLALIETFNKETMSNESSKLTLIYENANNVYLIYLNK